MTTDVATRTKGRAGKGAKDESGIRTAELPAGVERPMPVRTGRLMQQISGQFADLARAVAETFKNAVDASVYGGRIKVDVDVDRKGEYYLVRDFGVGMTADEVENRFFAVCGENEALKAGYDVHGEFGTGSFAPLGPARELILQTVKDGRRTTAIATRDEAGRTATFRFLEQDVPLAAVDADGLGGDSRLNQRTQGTTVIGNGLLVRKVNVVAVQRELEERLAVYPHAEVRFNGTVLAAKATPHEVLETFEGEGSGKGPYTLVIRKADLPLDESSRGVAFISGRSFMERWQGKVAGKPGSEYLFGELRCALSGHGAVPDYDQSRRSLNASPRVQALRALVDQALEKHRRRIARAQSALRNAADAARWQAEQAALTDIFNADIAAHYPGLTSFRSPGGEPPKPPKPPVDETEEEEDAEDDLPADDAETPDDTAPVDEAPEETGPEDADGKDPKDKKGEGRKPRRGLAVVFRNLGDQEMPYRFDATAGIVVVNRDYPTLTAAMEGRTVDHPIVRALSHEAAFQGYALAIATLLMSNGLKSPKEAVDEQPKVVDRLKRANMHLYRNLA